MCDEKATALKHLSGFLVRLLLFAALVMASMPAGATITVCVLRSGQVVVPVAKCKKACCAHEVASAAPARRNCCARSAVKPTAVITLGGDLGKLAGMSCRCEIRATINSPLTSTAPNSNSLLSITHPAILPPPTRQVPRLALTVTEPGIQGLDSGPPRKLPRSPRQSRAPPVCFF